MATQLEILKSVLTSKGFPTYDDPTLEYELSNAAEAINRRRNRVSEDGSIESEFNNIQIQLAVEIYQTHLA